MQRTLTLRDGTQFLQDHRGVITHLGSSANAPYTNSGYTTEYDEFEATAISNLDYGNAVSRVSHMLSSPQSFSGSEDPFPFTSAPIENLNFSLMRSIHMELDMEEDWNNHDIYSEVALIYHERTSAEPTLRSLGITGRVAVTRTAINLVVSNRSERRNRYLARSHSSVSTAMLLEDFSNRLGREEPMSRIWPVYEEGIRLTPDLSPRQLRSKTCLHKECIRCSGNHKDGRGKECLHHFVCSCIECQP